MPEKRWSVTIEVESSTEAAARLRALLPEFLHQAGYTTTSGTRTVEVSFLAATENLRAQPDLSVQSVPVEWMPRGRQGKRLGRGPNG